MAKRVHQPCKMTKKMPGQDGCRDMQPFQLTKVA